MLIVDGSASVQEILRAAPSSVASTTQHIEKTNGDSLTTRPNRWVPNFSRKTHFHGARLFTRKKAVLKHFTSCAKRHGASTDTVSLSQGLTTSRNTATIRSTSIAWLRNPFSSKRPRRPIGIRSFISFSYQHLFNTPSPPPKAECLQLDDDPYSFFSIAMTISPEPHPQQRHQHLSGMVVA